LFISNPARFLNDFSFPKDKPDNVKSYRAAECLNREKALKGYCPVSLTEKEDITKSKGYPLFISHYQGQRFTFRSQEAMIKF